MQPDRVREGRDPGRSLLGHGCIVLAICLLAALLSFPTGW